MDPAPRGNFTENTRPPFNATSGSAITLTTGAQAVVPTGSCPYFTPDWWYPGRLLYICHMCASTTGATPGAIFPALYYGNNTDGNGTMLQNTGLTWTANNVGAHTRSDWWMRCWQTGSSGQVFVYGTLFISGVGIIPINWTGNGGINVDTTQGGYIAPQYYRSGSTAETITHHDIVYKVMN